MRWLFKITVLAVVFCAVAIVALSVFPDSIQSYHRGVSLSKTLSNEIDEAKEVRVVEHSCSFDYNPPHDKNFVEKIYATVILNASQKEQLKAALSPSFDNSATTFMSCFFEPHHRIEMVHADDSVFKVELCFGCGELEVNGGGQRIFPNGWQARLESFITSLSLRPHAPWKDLVAPKDNVH